MPEENDIVDAEIQELEDEALDTSDEHDLEDLEDRIIQADVDNSTQISEAQPVVPPGTVIFKPQAAAQSAIDSVIEGSIRSFEQELAGFDRAVDKTSQIRADILDKLHQTVQGITSIDLNDGDDVNNKLSVINVTLKAAADMEASHVRRIATKRAYENQRSDDAMSRSIVDIFKQLAEERSGQGIPSDEEEAKLIDARFEEDNQPIMDTELRTDPDDIS